MRKNSKLPPYTKLKYGRTVRTTRRYDVSLENEEVEAIVVEYAKLHLFPEGADVKVVGTGARYEGCSCSMQLSAESVEEKTTP